MTRVDAEKFREMSVAEFFARYREVAGFANPSRALYQTIRELVENALDATDSHGILPDVKIYIDIVSSSDEKTVCRVSVEDNGVGIPPSFLPEAFGRVLFSSKYVLKQARGMYGIGVKAVVLYSQVTTGAPFEVYSSTRASSYVYMKKLQIDMRRNQPIVLEEGQWRKPGSWNGTLASALIECDWPRARARVLEYLRRTAIIAPYAEITLKTPEGYYIHFPRTTSKLPKQPVEVKPHPHGVDVETLKQMLLNTKAKTLLEFMVEEFQSVGETSARRFLESLGLDPEASPRELLEGETGVSLAVFVDALKSFKFRSPRSDALSPLGESIIEIGLSRMYSPEWVDAISRPPRAYQGHPFVVEAGLAYGGSIPPSDTPILLRYANKIPLIYEEKEDVAYKVVSEINWRNYGVETPAPLVVLVHIASTKIPYKGVGKESISEVPEIESEIRSSLLELARRLRAYISAKAREAEAMKRILVLSKYIPEVSRSLAVIASQQLTGSQSHDSTLEERIREKLIKLVAGHVTLPKSLKTGKSVEEIVRSVVEGVRIE
ncbi:MAG: DNA topoisomerase VI subunit B [Acidilobaceae archaeon]